jgi:hypothetical protein
VYRLNFPTFRRNILPQFSLSQFEVDVELIRKKRCVGYGDRFKGVWPNRATKSEKKGRDDPSRGTEIIKHILLVNIAHLYLTVKST